MATSFYLSPEKIGEILTKDAKEVLGAAIRKHLKAEVDRIVDEAVKELAESAEAAVTTMMYNDPVNFNETKVVCHISINGIKKELA